MTDTTQAGTRPKLPPVGAIFTGAWRRFVDRFWPLIWLNLPPGILVTYLSDIMSTASESGAAVEPMIWILFGIGYIWSLWASVATITLLAEEPGLGPWRALRTTLGKIPGYLGILILGGLIGLVGFLLFIIPGILFSVWFAYAWFVYLVENVSVFNAFSRSRRYVVGRWWATVGRFLAGSGVTYLFYLVIVFLAVAAEFVIGPWGRYAILALAFPVALYSIVYAFELYLGARKGVA